MEQILTIQWMNAAIIILYVFFCFFMANFLAKAILDLARKNTSKGLKYLLKTLVIAIGYTLLLKAAHTMMAPATWIVTACVIASGALAELLRRSCENIR